MKRMKKFLSMAALALVGAVMTGCSSDDDLQQPEKKSNVVTLTTTVNLGGDGTRALDAAGKRTFAVGDQIAVMYRKPGAYSATKAVSNALTAGDITNSGKSATLTFTLDDPDKTSNSLFFYYPASMVTDDGEVNYASLSTQDGTLATLGPTFDGCRSMGAWDDDNLPSVDFNQNLIAVLALTLKNSDGSSTITSGLKTVTVSDGTHTYTVNASGTTFGSDVIYVAIEPLDVATALTITATDGTTNYTKTTTARAYEKGNFYTMPLRMAAAASAPAGVEAVDLGLSVKWANMNVGATSETDYGDYFAWGETEPYYSSKSPLTWKDGKSAGYDWGSYQWGNSSNFSKYTSGDATLEAGDDAARANWGGSWRMPTAADFQELLNNTTKTEYLGSNKYNDANGILLTSKKEGYTDKSIFLPAAGFRKESELRFGDSDGYYWSSTLRSENVDFGRSLYFYSNSAAVGYNYRYAGLSVRAVQPKN